MCARGEEESPERIAFWGKGTGKHSFCCEAGPDILDGRDDNVDGVNSQTIVKDDQSGVWAHANKASHFVGGMKKCPTKVVGGGA